jgi:hypothetical protein
MGYFVCCLNYPVNSVVQTHEIAQAYDNGLISLVGLCRCMETLLLKRQYRQAIKAKHHALLREYHHQQQQQQQQQGSAVPATFLTHAELSEVTVWDAFFDTTLEVGCTATATSTGQQLPLQGSVRKQPAVSAVNVCGSPFSKIPLFLPKPP